MKALPTRSAKLRPTEGAKHGGTRPKSGGSRRILEAGWRRSLVSQRLRSSTPASTTEFRELHFAAARRELDNWIDHPESALALMILLDQFPRNCFRGTGHMYATDPLARHFARKALAAGHDRSR